MKKVFTLSLVGVLLLIGGYLAFSEWGRSNALPEGRIQANGRVEGDDVNHRQ